MSGAEIKQFVTDLLNEIIFTSGQCGQELVGNVFLPLKLGALNGWTVEEAAQIGGIWEYKSKAISQDSEGNPSFLSCRFTHRDDWALAKQMFEAAEKTENATD